MKARRSAALGERISSLGGRRFSKLASVEEGSVRLLSCWEASELRKRVDCSISADYFSASFSEAWRM
jgi:hypothetical protein